MDQSFWEQLASNPPEERGGYEDLPADSYVVVRTAGEENGKAAPEVRVQEIKRGERAGETFRQFSVGLITVGGDSKIQESIHNNKMIYMSSYLEPSEKELAHSPDQKVAGRFMGFLNALFASGVAEGTKDAKARSAARSSKTFSVLQKVAQETGLALSDYEGNTARYLAGLTVKALLAEPRKLSIKTKLRTYENDGEKRNQIEVGSYEDFSAANVAKRKITVFGPTAEF